MSKRVYGLLNKMGLTIIAGALIGRFGQQFKRGDALGPVTMRGADAVRPGVAAANDDHMFAGGRQIFFGR